MSTIQDFSGYNPTWCPGCGDWGIGATIKKVFVDLGYDPSSVLVVFGIGCSGNMNDFLNAYGLHSLHGRAIPNAIGMKLVNHRMPTVVIVGDGDCYGEGGNHFLHACRGNHDITVIVHDNGVYGLTTGQVAPTAQKGFKSKSTPEGIIEMPVNILTLAISQGATFVSQSFAGDVPHMVEMVKAGIKHKGFSLVNVLQPCVTFNKKNTYEYYRDRVYYLSEAHPREEFHLAMQVASQPVIEEKFPLGILYQRSKPVFTDHLSQLKTTTMVRKARFNEIDSLLADFI